MKNITTEEFKSNIMDYTITPHKFIGKKSCIVKFGSSWCSPCKMMNPVLEKLQDEYPQIEIFDVDVDEEHEVAAAFGIRSIPNMIFFSVDGEPERMVGAFPRKNVKDAIQRVFKL